MKQHLVSLVSTLIVTVAVAFTAVSFMTSTSAVAAEGVGVIEPKELKAKLDAKAEMLVIDVRTSEEFAEGHIPGAINIPHTAMSERVKEIETRKAEPIVLYCRSGRRADLAAEELIEAGFPNIMVLNGAIESWSKNNLPIEKNEK